MNSTLKRTVLAILLGTIGSVSIPQLAHASCSIVPQCHNTIRHEMRPHQENVCQYFGRQSHCYTATRYTMVPVTQQQCVNQRVCR